MLTFHVVFTGPATLLGKRIFDVFRAYFRDMELFRGMTHAMNQNEHTLEQHACFNEYLKLYEKQDYIEKDRMDLRQTSRTFTAN